jgi:hypothetical protein
LIVAPHGESAIALVDQFTVLKEKPSMRTITLLVAPLVAAAASVISAQTPAKEPLPMSPRGLAAAQVDGKWVTKEGREQYTDGKWITIDYGRPILRGRANIFASGAEYGKTVTGNATVWRAGANETTRLMTEAPLVFGGKTIGPGTYSVFVDLKQGAWTFVLSTQPAQTAYDREEKVATFGAYNYDPKYDVVRVPMTLSKSAVSVEQFTIGFIDMTQRGGSIGMWWDKEFGRVDFTVASGS